MKKRDCGLSEGSKRRLGIQGYGHCSDEALSEYRFGIRSAYAICGGLVLAGLVYNNVAILIVATGIAFLGTFPPYHPLDYLYNHLFRHLLKKQAIPPRPVQSRFACAIATVWLTITIGLLQNDYPVAGTIFAILLLIAAFLVSTIDLCIPSLIYRAMFSKKSFRGPVAETETM